MRRAFGTGRYGNGGYAELMVVTGGLCLSHPDVSDIEAAPLLCAGAIGYRSLRLSGLRDGQHLGLMGFGASAHLVLKMARRYPRSPVAVFSRSEAERRLPASWALPGLAT